MQSISSFQLTNDADFVCATGCVSTDAQGNQNTDKSGGDIASGSEFYQPGDHGVAAGDTVELYIVVHGGDDRTGGDQFTFDPAANVSASYSISGTTYSSTVHFEGVG